MNVRTKEALRYLGYKEKSIDAQTLQMIEESFVEIEKISAPKCIYRIFDISFIDDILIQSKNLKKNLKDCESVAIFCASLGAEVDRMIRTYEVKRISKAVVFNACAAAYLEEYCDNKQAELDEILRKNKLKTRPRFSPGYGDFSIKHQKQILDVLDASKNVGIMMTDSYMLVPTKSITAVIGISKLEETSYVAE